MPSSRRPWQSPSTRFTGPRPSRLNAGISETTLIGRDDWPVPTRRCSGLQARRPLVGAAGGNQPRSPMARTRPPGRCPRVSGAGLRMVHREVRHARSAAGEGSAPCSGLTIVSVSGGFPGGSLIGFESWIALPVRPIEFPCYDNKISLLAKVGKFCRKSLISADDRSVFRPFDGPFADFTVFRGHREFVAARVSLDRLCRCRPAASKLPGSSQRSTAALSGGHSLSRIENQQVSRLRTL